MKKTILIISLFIGITAKAQDYYQGAGLGILMGIYNQEYTTPFANITTSNGATVPGIMYKGTLLFDDSFGVTASPFLGFFLNSQGGSYLGFQLPLMAEYYVGDIDDQCFYLGGGFSYGFAAADGSGGPVLGPVLGLGGQFEIADNLYGLRANYTFGVNKERDVPAGWEYTKDTRGMLSISVYMPF